MDQLFILLRYICLIKQSQDSLKLQIANQQIEMFKKRYGKINDITVEEKITLARLGKKLGRKLLFDVNNIITPDTIMRWYKKYVDLSHTFDNGKRGRGRPGIMKIIVSHILSMALSNPDWGYGRIRGELLNIGHDVKKQTIKNTMKKNGIQPSPERRKNSKWNRFIYSNLEVLFATDFFTFDIVDAFHGFKVRTFYVLFFIHLETRKVHVAGITEHPSNNWMRRIAYNLTDHEDGFLKNCKYLIHDRDFLFMNSGFRDVLKNEGVKCIATARKAPNMNAFAERWVKSIKGDCLRKLMLFREESLRYAIKQYVTHYNEERAHQGIDNLLIEPNFDRSSTGRVISKKRLGGLLQHYHRKAA